MNGERNVLDRVQTGSSRAVRDQHDLVRLSKRSVRPVGGLLVRQIDDQLVFTFDRVQPIEDGRVLQLQIWKALFEVCVAEKNTPSRARKGTATAIKEGGGTAAVPSSDDGDRARRCDAAAARD